MRQTERDMRSLDRRGTYSIFAPLDPDERLPRELLLGRSRFHPFQGNTPWERAVSFLWIPFVLAALVLLVWGFGHS